MSRRKQKPAQVSSLLNRIICLTVVLFVFVGGFGLSTVYLRHEIANTANDIKRLERGVSLEKRKLASLGAEITSFTTRSSLKQKNIDYAFGLVAPEEDQVIRVTENVEARLYEKTAGNRFTASNF